MTLMPRLRADVTWITRQVYTLTIYEGIGDGAMVVLVRALRALKSVDRVAWSAANGSDVVRFVVTLAKDGRNDQIYADVGRALQRIGVHDSHYFLQLAGQQVRYRREWLQKRPH